METNRRSWHRPMTQVIMLLVQKNALSAACGRPCPISASVVARIESRMSYEKAMKP